MWADGYTGFNESSGGKLGIGYTYKEQLYKATWLSYLYKEHIL